ncbi:vegetative cell wall protein gp1-like [Enhydra lutris kenyoni]|uniref:Vegetative cell wall protein gp1-like n=1 Tax=Enhydra lutris kenyoni TaxID=391180 RepID=A0A2Y9L709_ENHLU|nr:vegetative cell wall protein gp1-like [Enhydra lutris kenyoni]
MPGVVGGGSRPRVLGAPPPAGTVARPPAPAQKIDGAGPRVGGKAGRAGRAGPGRLRLLPGVLDQPHPLPGSRSPRAPQRLAPLPGGPGPSSQTPIPPRRIAPQHPRSLPSTLNSFPTPRRPPNPLGFLPTILGPSPNPSSFQTPLVSLQLPRSLPHPESLPGSRDFSPRSGASPQHPGFLSSTPPPTSLFHARARALAFAPNFFRNFSRARRLAPHLLPAPPAPPLTPAPSGPQSTFRGAPGTPSRVRSVLSPAPVPIREDPRISRPHASPLPLGFGVGFSPSRSRCRSAQCWLPSPLRVGGPRRSLRDPPTRPPFLPFPCG